MASFEELLTAIIQAILPVTIFDHSSLGIFTDATMSAVIGETQFTSAGSSKQNFIILQFFGNPEYCAGCNGSSLHPKP